MDISIGAFLIQEVKLEPVYEFSGFFSRNGIWSNRCQPTSGCGNCQKWTCHWYWSTFKRRRKSRGTSCFKSLYRITKRSRHLCHLDRKSTRLNSSHVSISYAVFCLKKKNNKVLV